MVLVVNFPVFILSLEINIRLFPLGINVEQNTSRRIDNRKVFPVNEKQREHKAAQNRYRFFRFRILVLIQTSIERYQNFDIDITVLVPKLC